MYTRWSLQNKYALITGGTKGIGRATALEFLNHGARVCIVSRSEEDIAEFTKEHKNLIGIKADLSIPEEYNKVIDFVEDNFGKLDILVNNVGVNIRKKTLEYTPDEYEHIVNTNLRSAFELSRLAYPFLKRSGEGNIVNISSTAGQKHIRT